MKSAGFGSVVGVGVLCYISQQGEKLYLLDVPVRGLVRFSSVFWVCGGRGLVTLGKFQAS